MKILLPPPTVLKALPGTSDDSSCSDTDNNGIGGLLSFWAQFQDVHSKEMVRVEVTSSEDIDTTGIYSVTVVTDRFSVQAEVRVTKITVQGFDPQTPRT